MDNCKFVGTYSIKVAYMVSLLDQRSNSSRCKLASMCTRIRRGEKTQYSPLNGPLDDEGVFYMDPRQNA